MLREKILDLFHECDPEVRNVIERVLDAEWAKLSYERPRGIIDEIRHIVDSEARLKDDEN
jgi:hypothetical protein